MFLSLSIQKKLVKLLPSIGRYPREKPATCNLQFRRKVVAQPGADLGWTVCLSLPYKDKEDRNFVTTLMDEKYESPETTRWYSPPKMEDGIVTTPLMVGEKDTTNADANTVEITVNTSDTESTEIECQGVGVTDNIPVKKDDKVEEERFEDFEKNLGIDLLTSEKDEAEGVLSEGSADSEGEQDTIITNGFQVLGPEPTS